jgi:Fe(3+) dicitrate transport protein
LGKVPGIHIWESDGSGIQIGIAARGLSPNRSWEFNIRQNGCDIAADPFGYPEAYYNPQMQAVQRIQVVRGAGALQYGPQFGGMINYVMRNGSDINKPLQFETKQTLGSFGLINSYNAIGGEKGRLQYYAFYDVRKADGWRQNSAYNTNTAFASVTYKLSKSMRINAEYMSYGMLSQQPGGLTESQLKTNPKASERSRNWFSTPWRTSSIKYDWEIGKSSRLNAKIYHISGDRSSVGMLAPVTVKDSINKLLGTYNPREVAIDKYRNTAIEAGYLHDYNLFKQKQTISIGAKWYKGNTFRQQKGIGTNSVGADFSIVQSAFPTEVTYGSVNQAFYAENVFRLVKKLLIIPGIRMERIAVEGSGRLGYHSNGTENNMTTETRLRSFVLPGIGLEYHIGKKGHNEIYANYTQAYRPILFSNITSPTTDVVDANLKDSRGYNADLGFRGTWGQYLHIDAGVYYMQYNNRIATSTLLNASNQAYKYVTNAGGSHSYGLESLIDFDPMHLWAPSFQKKYGSLPFYVSYAYNVSLYNDFIINSVVNNKLEEKNLSGNTVEYAPRHILRAGISYQWNRLKISLQQSYCSSVFSDADNTVNPSSNGQTGQIPAYTIYDLMGSIKVNKSIDIKFAVNNLSNKIYYTRRSGGYPGPGILPSDGRSILLTLAGKF